MGKITTCDPEKMLSYYVMLAGIIQELDEAYTSANTIIETFDGGYEGEAKEEIGMFLTSLPMHICRLELFYSKMMAFLTTTVKSFMQSDIEMSLNMEK